MPTENALVILGSIRFYNTIPCMQGDWIHKLCAREKELDWPMIVFEPGLDKALTRPIVVSNQLRRGAEVGHHHLDYVGTA